MKVGVVFGEQLPEIGGGHTFTSQLFRSILKLESEASHTFVIFSFNKEIPNAVSQSRNIQYASLYPNFQKRLQYKWDATKNAFLKKLHNPRCNFQIEQWYPKFILDSMVFNGIDILWNLNLSCITTEVPYIATVWDLAHRIQPYFPEVSTEGWKWDEREKFYEKTLRRASIVLTGTEAGKAEIKYFYQVPAERIRVLPFPTPDFVLNPLLCQNKQILEKYKIPDNYLFYPAQFWPHKNHANLLLAVKYLKDKHNLGLPVVFSGSDQGNQPYIRQMVDELELSQQVYFLGFVPQEDLISLYRNAFALTFVTFFGPDNLPPLEAFALGCPVVASKVSGAQEQLGDAALLVDPKDPEHIALAIKSLWDDINLRQFIVQKGLARASQWSGDDYVKGVFSILDEFAAIRCCWSSTNPNHL